MHLNTFSVGALFACCLALSACNDQKSSSEQPAQSSAEQQEVAKFNVYVEAANNLVTPFAKELADYQEYREPDVKSGEKLDNYSVVPSRNVTNMREKLARAAALPFAMPEIDAPAKAFDDALAKFQPLDAELSNYADSKGYLADGGKKAKEQNDVYLSALTDVAKAEAAFLSGIQKQDEINTRTAFEKAPKDSQDYYRIGLILHAREAIRLGDAVFEAQGAKEAIEPLRTSLDKVATMAEGWEKKARETAPNGCPATMDAINDFLALGRTVIQHAEGGEYTPKDNASWSLNNPIQYDQGTFQLRFNALIGLFNYPRC